MRFITFRSAGSVRAGVLKESGADGGDRIVDLAHQAMGPALKGTEPQISAFLDAGMDAVAAAISNHRDAPEAELSFGEVELLAPIPRPRRIFAFAHNYHDALAERGMPAPSEPVLFMKQVHTVIGSGEAIVLPEGIGGCTYEAELAAVIGRRTENVAAEDALAHVAAYAVFNDISASEMIRRDGRLERGKNLPTFGPFGPYLLTADDIADPQDLEIELAIDDTVLQRSSTKLMLFSVAELVAFLSRQAVLEPGDVIATGTPAGVAPLQDPPTWLQPGMTVHASVEGLGTLTNSVTAGSVPHD